MQERTLTESQILLRDTEDEPLPCSPHPAHNDLALTRISGAIVVVSYLLIVLSTGPVSWTFATQLGSLSSGFSPFISSVAFFLLPGGKDQAGAFFGGLGVVQTLL